MLPGATVDKKTFNEMKKCVGLSEDERLQLYSRFNTSAKPPQHTGGLCNRGGKEQCRPINKSVEELWRERLGRGPWVSWWAQDYWPSAGAVSAEAKISRATVTHHIERLQEHGVLVKKHHECSHEPELGFRHTRVYILNLRALSPRLVEFPQPTGDNRASAGV
jgi:hypothetical protein